MSYVQTPFAKGLRVLVCGGRNFGRSPDERLMLSRTLDMAQPGSVIHGAARGADTLAGSWAKEHGLPIEAFPANWRPDGPNGPVDMRAGLKRNKQMLEEAKPDLIIAFPGGSGTAHMVKTANSRGFDVYVAGRH